MAKKTDTTRNIPQNSSGQPHAAIPVEAKARAERVSRPRRKSGGQPGNQNARKHGFYSRYLTQEQRDAYRAAKYGPSLTPEIAIMRLIVRDIMADPDADQVLLLRSVRTLARLLSVQTQLRNVP